MNPVIRSRNILNHGEHELKEKEKKRIIFNARVAKEEVGESAKSAKGEEKIKRNIFLLLWARGFVGKYQ